jgi:protein arginine kinase activator
MLCQQCQQQEAIVHFLITENEKTREVFLCESCAKKNQKFGFVNPAVIPDFLKALFGFNPNLIHSSSATEQLSAEQTCPKCGITFSRITQVGKLGCSQCYETFETQLESLLRRVHGRRQNVGKIPARRGAAIKSRVELNKLKEKLQLLVQQEAFEEAAVVRDKIRQLEQTKGEENRDA